MKGIKQVLISEYTAFKGESVLQELTTKPNTPISHLTYLHRWTENRVCPSCNLYACVRVYDCKF